MGVDLGSNLILALEVFHLLQSLVHLMACLRPMLDQIVLKLLLRFRRVRQIDLYALSVKAFQLSLQQLDDVLRHFCRVSIFGLLESVKGL